MRGTLYPYGVSINPTRLPDFRPAGQLRLYRDSGKEAPLEAFVLSLMVVTQSTPENGVQSGVQELQKSALECVLLLL